MRKVPTLFRRDPEDMRRLLREVNPACQWVADGEGVPTRKYDGTCVMRDVDGRWWARREVKPGKPVPPDFAEADYDEVTGKTVGWEPIEQSPFVKMWQEALTSPGVWQPSVGTYELCGPKVNGNPERFPAHVLIRHGEWKLDAPRDYDGLQAWLSAHEYEGIVWHRTPGDPSTDLAKIKRRDFA